MDFLIPSASFGISMAFSASSKTEAALIFCSVCIFFCEAVKEKKSQVSNHSLLVFRLLLLLLRARKPYDRRRERKRKGVASALFVFDQFILMRSIIDAVRERERERERECALI